MRRRRMESLGEGVVAVVAVVVDEEEEDMLFCCGFFSVVVVAVFFSSWKDQGSNRFCVHAFLQTSHRVFLQDLFL